MSRKEMSPEEKQISDLRARLKEANAEVVRLKKAMAQNAKDNEAALTEIQDCANAYVGAIVWRYGKNRKNELGEPVRRIVISRDQVRDAIVRGIVAYMTRDMQSYVLEVAESGKDDGTVRDGAEAETGDKPS